MADETVKIIEVEVRPKGQTLADLQKEVIDAKVAMLQLTQAVKDGTATEEEYQQGLVSLKTAQDQYNKEMRISVKENQAAKGSYNDLVNQLARLKEAWKQAEPNSDAYKDLTSRVNVVKKQLEDMDHEIGNWQRNVGNYTNSIKDALKDFPSFAGPVKKGLDDINKTSALLSKNPLLGIVSLMLPLVTNLAGKLRENDTAMQAIERTGKALQPLLNFAQSVLEKIAQVVAKVADRFVALAGESGGTFQKIIAGAVGVGNVILQYVLTPIRTTIKAFQGLGNIVRDIFTGNFKQIKQDATEAFEGIKDAFVKGFSVKQNFELGKQVGEQFAAGLGSTKPKAQAAARDMVKAVAAELAKITPEMLDRMDEATRKRIEAAKARAQELAEIDRLAAEMSAEAEADAAAALAQYAQEEANATKAAQDQAAARAAAYKSMSSAIMSILDDLAGAYQNDIKARIEAGKISEAQGEKEFEDVKALQYANTWINTIAGMTAALTSPTLQNAGPLGWAAAAAQAAAIFTAGVANTIKIANTKLGSTQTSSAAGSGVQQATATAPAAVMKVPEYHAVTNAEDEDRLNRRAAAQKVYLVTSELEMHQEGRKVQLAESSF